MVKNVLICVMFKIQIIFNIHYDNLYTVYKM